MYQLVDRPLADLPLAERFLLDAMRLWTAAHARGQCPNAVLRAPFAAARAQDILGHFNMTMTILTHDGTTGLSFSTPHHPVIGEDEAVLLSVWRTAAAGRAAQLRATLALLVTDSMAGAAARACAAAATALREAGLTLAPATAGREGR